MLTRPNNTVRVILSVANGIDYTEVYEDLKKSGLSVEDYWFNRFKDYIKSKGLPDGYVPSLNTLRRRLSLLHRQGLIPSTHFLVAPNTEEQKKRARMTLTLDYEDIFDDFQIWGGENIQLYHSSRLPEYLIEHGYPKDYCPSLTSIRNNLNTIGLLRENNALREENARLKSLLADMTPETSNSNSDGFRLFSDKSQNLAQKDETTKVVSQTKPPADLLELFLNFEFPKAIHEQEDDLDDEF